MRNWSGVGVAKSFSHEQGAMGARLDTSFLWISKGLRSLSVTFRHEGCDLKVYRNSLAVVGWVWCAACVEH